MTTLHHSDHNAQGEDDSLEDWFGELVGELEQTDEYWIGAAQDDIASGVWKMMQGRGMSKADLARRLGKSRPYITKILRGDANLTIESLVKISRALGCHFQARLEPQENEAPPSEADSALSPAERRQSERRADERRQGERRVEQEWTGTSASSSKGKVLVFADYKHLKPALKSTPAPPDEDTNDYDPIALTA